MNNNLPILKEKETIFSKIRKFLKKLFSLNSIPNYNLAIEEVAFMENKNMGMNFKDEIKIKEDEEKKELLKLQEKFEKGLIKEEQLSDEQFAALEKLYVEQIQKLDDDFIEYKNKITKIRSQLSV